MNNYNYPVRLNWCTNPNMTHWNEVCAWGVEHMGLPGDRYCTEITEEYMIWNFMDRKDQLLFSVAWGNDGS
jgi:hypothetical protein